MMAEATTKQDVVLDNLLDLVTAQYSISENNNTNSTHPVTSTPLFKYDIQAVITPIIFIIIFVIGLVGNGTLIYTVAKNKNLRNTPNIFIVSLATGDLLLILIAVPINATYFTFTYWPYGLVVCKLQEFMQTLSLGVSVFTLVALSGDRYVAIAYPMSKHKGSPTLRTCIIAAGIWLVSGLLALLDAIKTELSVFVSGQYTYTFCWSQSPDPSDNYARFRTMFRFGVYFAAPVLIITTFYILMARILILSSKRMPGESKSCSNQVTRQLDARKKVAKVVLSFVLVFVTCWLPYHIFRIWFYFLPGDFNMFWYVFKVLAFCMAFFNSCINPFALYFLSKQFRKYFNNYLFCCCTQNSDHTENAYQTTLYQFNSANTGRSSNSAIMTTYHTVC